MALLSFLIYFVFLTRYNNLPYARSAAFLSMVFMEVFLAFGFVDMKNLTLKSFYKNEALLFASGISLLGSLAIVYLPINKAFDLIPLELHHLSLIVLFSLIVVVIMDLIKFAFINDNDVI